jgi:predicted DNA-binding WGR domain protein
MNRSASGDSNPYHWTPECGCAILPGMIAQQYRLYIERRDPDRNMARFYALSIEETLFGQACLVRRWGRIGTHGRTVQHSFDDEREAVSLFLDLLRTKRVRGYGPGSISRGANASSSG